MRRWILQIGIVLASLLSSFADAEPRKPDIIDRVKHMIQNSQFMGGGLYGKIGRATIFVAPKIKIPDNHRVYWMMVRVLSEKYGCFMRGKTVVENQTTFRCRDGRKVAMWRTAGPDWIMFYGRQFDGEGYELAVEDGTIIKKFVAAAH